MAERIHRVHLGSAHGRVDAEGDTYEGRNAEREQRRPEGYYGLHVCDMANSERDDDAEEHSNEPSQTRNPQASVFG